MSKMEKVKTGIPGLDKMLEGGLPENRPYLIQGGPGTGKTILCMQFLLEGSVNGEKCVYISLEEPEKELIENMAQLDFSIDNLIILDLSPDTQLADMTDSALAEKNMAIMDEFNLKQKIEELIEKEKPDRLVFDSITMFSKMYQSDYDARREMLLLMRRLSLAGCTSVFISEDAAKIHEPVTNQAGFLSRGIIKLYSVNDRGERRRGVQIDKLRGTAFDEQIRPIQITGKGIVVHADSVMM